MISDECIDCHDLISLRESIDKPFHICIRQVFELVAAEDFALLGTVYGRGLVGLADNGEIGKVLLELPNELVFL